MIKTYQDNKFDIYLKIKIIRKNIISQNPNATESEKDKFLKDINTQNNKIIKDIEVSLLASGRSIERVPLKDKNQEKNRIPIKTPLPINQSPEFYRIQTENIIILFGEYQKTLFVNAKSGNGFKKIKGPRKMRNIAIKHGNGVEHFVHKHLYINMNKLNSNIMSIKYIKNGNIKIEVSISDNVKLVIVQLITKKFNINVYNKLDEKEKKIISYFNDMFKIVNAKEVFLNDPIENLYEKYQILIGSINASNNNPVLITNLKDIAFELHKYKKISTSELRNVLYDLSTL